MGAGYCESLTNNSTKTEIPSSSDRRADHTTSRHSNKLDHSQLIAYVSIHQYHKLLM